MTGAREAQARWWSHEEWATAGRPALAGELDRCLGVGVRGALDPARAASFAAHVLAAEAEWTSDFGGEQFTLGKAFYTHLEQDRLREYFAGARAADALVEQRAPGLQREVLGLFEALTGGVTRPRVGFCGPGIHVFPAGCPVAMSGGVIHADIEGLTEHQVRRGTPAFTLVVALAAPAAGGGLRLWDALHHRTSALDPDDLDAPCCEVHYAAGDALLFESRRVHRIEPFSDCQARVTATVHAALVDMELWETWF